jgi:hypothetical protein
MVLTKQNNTDLTPEQKLGLNLTKDLFTVLTSDTEKVVSLKYDIIEIDRILKIGNDEGIVQCNAKMTSKYFDTLTTSPYCLKFMPLAELRKKSFGEKYYSLYAVGLALIVMVLKEKGVEFTEEVGKSFIEYIVDKLKEKPISKYLP